MDTAENTGQGGTAVQSGNGTQAQPSPNGDSQGLIAPYLEGVPDEHRSHVEAALSAYRRDSDARITKRFEESASRLKAYERYGSPEDVDQYFTIGAAAVENPVGTVTWLAEQLEAAGRPVATEIITALSEITKAAAAEQQAGNDKPLSMQDVERQVEARLEAYQRQAETEREAAENQQRAQGWIDDAFKRAGFEHNNADNRWVTAHAIELIEGNPSMSGQEAIDRSVEALVTRIRDAAAGTKRTQQPLPRVATGGGGVGPSRPPLTTANDRTAYAAQLLRATQEG